MTDQEIFDTVVKHLLAQGKPAMTIRMGSDGEMHEVLPCLYRNQNGMKCAVGCLIPDELYKPEMETNTVDALRQQEKFSEITELLDLTNENRLDFLSNLQSVHDECFDSVEMLKKQLTWIAVTRGLNKDVLND